MTDKDWSYFTDEKRREELTEYPFVWLVDGRDGQLYPEGCEPKLRNDLVVNDSVSLHRERR